MRQRLNKSIKIVFLLSVVFHLFTNCEKDEPSVYENTSKNQLSYNVVSLNTMNELQPVTDNVKQITPKNSGFSRNISDFIEVCVFSTVPSCDYGGQMHPWRANCTGI